MTRKTFSAFFPQLFCYFVYMHFFQKVFDGVFELPLLRNAAIYIRGGGVDRSSKRPRHGAFSCLTQAALNKPRDTRKCGFSRRKKCAARLVACAFRSTADRNARGRPFKKIGGPSFFWPGVAVRLGPRTGQKVV
jgi:hypothetical protein